MQNGFKIANLRIMNNISQNDMAKILHISLNSYKKYEDNKVDIKLEQLNIIANMFNVSLNYLVDLTNNIRVIKKISSEIDYKYLRFCLKYQRRIKRINKMELAYNFNISPQTILNYEKNAQNMPISYLVMFAKKFEMSIDYICGKSLQKKI